MNFAVLLRHCVPQRTPRLIDRIRDDAKAHTRDRFMTALQTPKTSSELAEAIGCSRKSLGAKIRRLIARGEPIVCIGAVDRPFGNKEKVWSWRGGV